MKAEKYRLRKRRSINIIRPTLPTILQVCIFWFGVLITASRLTINYSRFKIVGLPLFNPSGFHLTRWGLNGLFLDRPTLVGGIAFFVTPAVNNYLILNDYCLKSDIYIKVY